MVDFKKENIETQASIKLASVLRRSVLHSGGVYCRISTVCTAAVHPLSSISSKILQVDDDSAMTSHLLYPRREVAAYVYLRTYHG